MLAAQPDEVARDLVPKILGVSGNGAKVELLTLTLTRALTLVPALTLTPTLTLTFTLTLALALALTTQTLALALTLTLTKVEFLTTDRILSAFFRRFIKGALTTLTLSLTQLTPEP